MAAGIFLGIWALLGLGVLLSAMRGGPRGVRESLHAQSRRTGRAVASVVAVVGLGAGIVVPALVLAANGAHKDRVGPGGITLTAAEAHGRDLFAARCATCHTLEAAHAVGRVGPNLDALRPPSVLVLDAIDNGRARGSGQMPAQLLYGTDAKDVADFVAAVAGH